MVVGALKVCLSATISTALTSRSPLLGLMPVLRFFVDQLRRQRRFGEIRLPVERRIDRRANQRRPGEGGENRAAEPSQRDAPPVEGALPVAADLDRGLQTEVSDRRRNFEAVMSGQRIHTPDKFPLVIGGPVHVRLRVIRPMPCGWRDVQSAPGCHTLLRRITDLHRVATKPRKMAQMRRRQLARMRLTDSGAGG